MLKIERKSDNRVLGCIEHLIADIRGGVSIKTAELGGSAVLESTPLAYAAADGLYHVCKTALIVTDAADNATTYQVAKGHHFKVGDLFGTEGANGQAITAIDKTTYTNKDVITVGTTLGVAITAASKTVAFETNEAAKTPKYAPTVIAGSSYDVGTSENLFVDAWVIAVIKKGNEVPVNDTLKGTLKGVSYIN